jgi:antitoxin VapB
MQAMALSIKSEHAEELARKVARETGESITEAIRKSLEERWLRLRSRRAGRMLREKIDDILRRTDAMAVLDQRTPDEILGYDDNGVAR